MTAETTSQRPALSFAKTTSKGTFWTYITFYGGKVLVLISTIILARLLTKEDFGIVGFALLVISFLSVLEDLGIGAALIYHDDDDDSANTGFWLGLMVGFALCLISWLIAPLAGLFFNDSRAVPMTRALAFTFPLFALGNVHNVLLQKRLEFKQRFLPEMAKMGGKGVIAILLATLNFGAWSLVIGQLTGMVIASLLYWRVLSWRPVWQISTRFVRPLLSYGSSIVLVNAVAMISKNADYLFVGRFLGATALGVYTLAFRIPEMLILQFCQVIAKVLFPVYAKMRDDASALRAAFLLTLRSVSTITVPLGLGLALVSEPLVLTVFTPKWAEAIPVIRAIAMYTTFLSLAYNVGSFYKSHGYTMLMTKLATLRTIVLLPALWWVVTGPGTIAAVGWVQASIALLSGTLNLVVAAHILKIPLSEIEKSLRPALIGGGLMTPVVIGVLVLSATLPAWAQLLLAASIGAITYGLTQWWLQPTLVQHLGRQVYKKLGQR